MSREEKVINEFTKLLTNLGKDTAESKKNTKQLIALTKEQLSAIRELAGGFEDSQTEFKAVETPKVFESKSAEDKFEKEMIDKQEKLEKVFDEDLESLQDDILEGNDIMAEMLKEMDENDKKEEKRNRESEKVTTSHFEALKSSFIDAGKYLSELTGISSIVDAVSGLSSVVASSFEEQFGQLGTLVAKTVISPLKGLGSSILGGFGGMMGLGAQESQESQRAEDIEMNSLMLETLANIDENTRKEDEMLKGGSLGDFFKKMKSFLPAGMFTRGTGGVGGKMGGMLSKMLGAGLILGGVVWMATDFIDGFQKGGMKQGISQALLGKTDGTIESAFKNAGKWALIGAGIGSFVPVVGTIAGGIIGASVGLLLNYIGSLVKSDASVGSKIGDFFLGGNGGILSSVFNGSKWGAVGALIGTAFAPGVGTIAGGIIGFVFGFLFNFVKQMLPDSLKTGLVKMGNWISDIIGTGIEYIGKAFSWWWDTTKAMFFGYINTVKWAFGLIGSGISWVGEKIYALAEWLGVSEYIDKAGAMIKKGWNAVTGVFDKFVDWISNIAGEIWEWVKADLSDSWERLQNYLFHGGEDGKKKEKEARVVEQRKQYQSEMININKRSGMSEKDAVQKAESQTSLKFGMAGISPDQKKAESKKQNETKIVEKDRDSLFNMSVGTETVANETPVINENLVEGNSFSEMIAKNLRSIKEFLKGDMLASLEQFLVKQVEDTIAGMRILQQEQRMYDYAMETGSLKGYASKTQEYAQELKKLDKGKAEGYTGMKNAMTQVNQNQNSVTNNIITTGLEDTLRKK